MMNSRTKSDGDRLEQRPRPDRSIRGKLAQMLSAGAVVCVLAVGCGGFSETRKGNQAPVESAAAVEEKNRHLAAVSAGQPEAEDWTLKQAWGDQSNLAQTGLLINPAGSSLRVTGRVMSIALVRQGRYLAVKTDARLAIIDADAFKVLKLVFYSAKNIVVDYQ